jgi:P pilus assembly chaperone PapD
MKQVSALKIITGLIVTAISTSTLANISFTEYRIYLTEDKAFSELQVINNGTAPRSCNISTVDYDVSPNNRLTQLKMGEKAMNSASEFIKFSPRRVTIPANKMQKVKIISPELRRKRLDDGEYVSYIELSCPQSVNSSDRVKLNANYQYHIPVIIRKGELTADLKFQNVSLNNNQLNLEMNKEGNRSTYGSLTVLDSNNKVIGQQTNISHYIQSKIQPLSIPLKAAGVKPYKVVYKEDKKYGGDAELTVTIN